MKFVGDKSIISHYNWREEKAVKLNLFAQTDLGKKKIKVNLSFFVDRLPFWFQRLSV